MIRWQNQNQIIQDLELVSNLIIQNRLVEAEEIMKERLRVSGSVPVVPWMIEAWKLRLDAAEKGNDQEKTRNLVQELLDDNSGDIIYPGDPLWIRCVLIQARNSLELQDTVKARQYFDLIIEHSPSTTTMNHSEALLGLARLDLSEGDFDGGIGVLKKLTTFLPESSPLKLKAELVLGKANMALLLQPAPYLIQVSHQVRSGDTIEKLCLQYRATQEEIGKDNPQLDLGKPLQEGENIRITASDSFYQVKRGDTIIGLGKRFDVSPDLIMHVNQIDDPRSLRIGRRIKIPNLRLDMIVDKAENTLTLLNHGVFLKKYRVRTGQHNRLTPTGEFKILNKIKDPEWTNPRDGSRYGPGEQGNELGTRWMGFEGRSLGLHEAVNPDTIGTYSSFGCIGLIRSDIEEIFNLVPIGTRIEITGSMRKPGQKRRVDRRDG